MSIDIQINTKYNCETIKDSLGRTEVLIYGEHKIEDLPECFSECRYLENEKYKILASLDKAKAAIQAFDHTIRKIIYKGYTLDVHHTIGTTMFIWTSPNHPLPNGLLNNMRFPGPLEYTGQIELSDPGIESVTPPFSCTI